MNVETWKAGVRRELWDDTARTYTAWTAAGAVVAGTPRPMNAAELLDSDARIAAGVPVTNKKTLEDALIASIAALKADIDLANTDLAVANATMNGSPAAYIKDSLRIAKDNTRAILRLAKIVEGLFQDADTGAA